MVAIPAEIPLTKPVAVIVAIVCGEDPQVFVPAAVVDPVSWDVSPIQENKVPVIVGEGFIVNELLAVLAPHSLVTFKE
jgi:hypothetical protein